jgi:uncharacterized Fe-S cluster-containing radical SAM superfamily protein
MKKMSEKYRQPLQKKVIDGLISTQKRFGAIYPVIKSEDGEVIDGFHRLSAGWDNVITLPIKERKDKLALKLTLNAVRRTMPPEEKKAIVSEIAQILVEKGVPKGKPLVKALSKEIGLSERWVYKYLPRKFKEENRGRPVKEGFEIEFEYHAKSPYLRLVIYFSNDIGDILKKCMDKLHLPTLEETVIYLTKIGLIKEGFKVNEKASGVSIKKEEKHSNMYPKTKTWNPFVGCKFDCKYCFPTFHKQLKRRKQKCEKCYNYHPHEHPERLKRIPNSEIIFVAGDGDLSFCNPDYTRKIIDRIKEHNKRCRNKKIFYFQSKNPKYFEQFLKEFPDNVVLLTTLETNRDENYESISKAPKPSQRYRDFLALNYPRKVVTIEPVMDFDTDIFLDWILTIKPLYVWFGFNSHHKTVQLPEPSIEKAQEFVDLLKANNIEVKGKNLRGLKV